MVKRESEKSVIKTAYGKTLAEPIPYEFEWDTFGEYADLVERKLEIGQKEACELRSAQSKANARQEAWTKALEKAGIKPPDKSEPQEMLKSIFRTLMLDKRQNLTEEQARAKASAFLGVAWED